MGIIATTCGEPLGLCAPAERDPEQTPFLDKKTDDGFLAPLAGDDYDEQDSLRTSKQAWIKAVETGNVNWVAVLNEEFPDTIIETVFPDGDRAVHKAIRNKDNKMTFFLLDCGAHPNAPNATTGDTPLHLAVEAENFNLISLLLHHNANPELRNTFGETPIEAARRKGNQNLLSLLSPEAMFLIDQGLGAGEDITEEKIVEDYQPKTYAQPDHSWSSKGSEVFDGEEPVMVWSRTEKPVEERKPSKPSQSTTLRQPPRPQRTKDSSTNAATVVDDVEEKVAAPAATVKPTPDAEAIKGVMTRTHTVKYLQKIENIREEQQALTDLSGWLDKKRPKPPYNWQRRWVVVKGSYILWADKQINTTNPSNPKERKRFNQSLSFMMISAVEPITSRSGQKFKICVRFSRNQKGPREYEFKAQSRTDRDFWVAKLTEHKQHYEQMLNTLESN